MTLELFEKKVAHIFSVTECTEKISVKIQNGQNNPRGVCTICMDHSEI